MYALSVEVCFAQINNSNLLAICMLHNISKTSRVCTNEMSLYFRAVEHTLKSALSDSQTNCILTVWIQNFKRFSLSSHDRIKRLNWQFLIQCKITDKKNWLGNFKRSFVTLSTKIQFTHMLSDSKDISLSWTETSFIWKLKKHEYVRLWWLGNCYF